jgi:hypothetical protein
MGIVNHALSQIPGAPLSRKDAVILGVLADLDTPTGEAVAATGYIAFTTNPAAATAITLNGTAVTFRAADPGTDEVLIGENLAATLVNLLAVLEGSIDAELVKFTYAVVSSRLNLTAATAGPGGNDLTVATTVSGSTRSAATLTGGTGGAGTSVEVAVTGLELPETYTVNVTPDQDAVCNVTDKTQDGFTITLYPRLAASTLVAGTVDVQIMA